MPWPELLGIDKLNNLNPYFIARTLEIDASLNDLVDQSLINPNNFHLGTLLDLASGVGSGMFALRQKSNQPIIGVDNESLVPSYGNRLAVNLRHGTGTPIPAPNATKLANSSFVYQNMIDFISTVPDSRCSLITIFHTSLDQLPPEFINNLGRVLISKGQVLVTSDLYRHWIGTTTPDWALKVDQYAEDRQLSDGRTQLWGRYVKSPVQLINRLGGWDNLKQTGATSYLETDSKDSGFMLFRDRHRWILTKK